MRDDFSPEVKRITAARVGHFCSNPECHKLTSGPQTDPAKALNIGVASHITAASPGGPRYKSALSVQDRKHADNAIWLCQDCGKLIDNDPARFSEDELRRWKEQAEQRAGALLGKPNVSEHAEARPKLEFFYRTYLDTPRPQQGHILHLIVGIKNSGTGVARFPMLEILPNEVFKYNSAGLDGAGMHGLKYCPPNLGSDSPRHIYSGGADDVIHPGKTFEIGIFTARLSGVDAIGKVLLGFELQCEDYNTTGEVIIGLEEQIRLNYTTMYRRAL